MQDCIQLERRDPRDGSVVTRLTAMPYLLRPYVGRHSKFRNNGFWFSLKLTMTVYNCTHAQSSAITNIWGRNFNIDYVLKVHQYTH